MPKCATEIWHTIISYIPECFETKEVLKQQMVNTLSSRHHSTNVYFVWISKYKKSLKKRQKKC